MFIGVSPGMPFLIIMLLPPLTFPPPISIYLSSSRSKPPIFATLSSSSLSKHASSWSPRIVTYFFGNCYIFESVCNFIKSIIDEKLRNILLPSWLLSSRISVSFLSTKGLWCFRPNRSSSSELLSKWGTLFSFNLYSSSPLSLRSL